MRKGVGKGLYREPESSSPFLLFLITSLYFFFSFKIFNLHTLFGFPFLSFFVTFLWFLFSLSFTPDLVVLSFLSLRSAFIFSSLHFHFVSLLSLTFSIPIIFPFT